MRTLSFESIKIRLDVTVPSFIIYHNITPSDASIARTGEAKSSHFYSISLSSISKFA